MKIPKKIKISGHVLKIKEVAELDNNQNLGRYTMSKNEILLDKNSDVQQKESTFFHEIIEALNSMYEIGLKHRDISTLENSLYQVLKDNNLLK